MNATPAVAAPFRWSECVAGLVLRCGALEPFAAHAFTTGQLQFRSGTETSDYASLARLFDLDEHHVIRVAQVHGRAVHVFTSGTPHSHAVAADAIVTDDPGVAVSVRVADCVPILIAARSRPIVAAVHAGWRGTAARVAQAAVRASAALGASPGDLVAAIGPSIGPCCYQVDDRVREVFLASDRESDRWFAPDGERHWTLDLWSATRDQLMEAGLRTDAIATARLCTADHPALLPSHRRDGASAGRMVAAIRIGQTRFRAAGD